ncbi:MAG: thioredoxin fold domain-containing protein [Bacteroidota bacterium]
MMKTLQIVLLLISLSAMPFAGIGQQLESTSIELLEQQVATTPKYSLVFLHTDWCRFCAAMKNTTFKDADVVNMLNDQFYYVPFNGEQRESVQFVGTTYNFVPTGLSTGTHEFASAIGTVDGQLAYPTTIILDSEFRIVFRNNSFLGAEDLLTVLRGIALGE